MGREWRSVPIEVSWRDFLEVRSRFFLNRSTRVPGIDITSNNSQSSVVSKAHSYENTDSVSVQSVTILTDSLCQPFPTELNVVVSLVSPSVCFIFYFPPPPTRHRSITGKKNRPSSDRRNPIGWKESGFFRLLHSSAVSLGERL